VARGYPDFFGYSIFPWHGSIRQDGDAVNVGIGATETVLSLTGKRVVYSAFIAIDSDRQHRDDVISLEVDGNRFSTGSWLAFRGDLSEAVVPSKGLLLRYDEEAFIYRLRYSGEFCVGQVVSLIYTNNSANLVAVSTAISSAIIQ